MLLSDCMIIFNTGTLVYLGDKGKLYEIVGGKDGQINLRKLG